MESSMNQPGGGDLDIADIEKLVQNARLEEVEAPTQEPQEIKDRYNPWAETGSASHHSPQTQAQLSHDSRKRLNPSAATFVPGGGGTDAAQSTTTSAPVETTAAGGFNLGASPFVPGGGGPPSHAPAGSFPPPSMGLPPQQGVGPPLYPGAGGATMDVPGSAHRSPTVPANCAFHPATTAYPSYQHQQQQHQMQSTSQGGMRFVPPGGVFPPAQSFSNGHPNFGMVATPNLAPNRKTHHQGSISSFPNSSSSGKGGSSSGGGSVSNSNSGTVGPTSIASSNNTANNSGSLGPPGYSLPARYYPNNPSLSAEGKPITSGPTDSIKPAKEASVFAHLFDQNEKLIYIPYPELTKMAFYERRCSTSGLPPENQKPYFGVFLNNVPTHLTPCFIAWALDLLAGRTSLIFYTQARKSGFAKAYFGNEQAYQTLMKRSKCLTFDLNGIWLTRAPTRRGRNLGQKFLESRFSYRVNPSIYVYEGAREERRKELTEDYYVVSTPAKFPDEKVRPLRKAAREEEAKIRQQATVAEKDWTALTDEELLAEARAIERSKEKKKYTAPAIDQFGSDDLYVNLPTDEDRYEYYERRGMWLAKASLCAHRNKAATPAVTEGDVATLEQEEEGVEQDPSYWEMETVMMIAWRKMYHMIQDYYRIHTGRPVAIDDSFHDYKTCPDSRLPHGPLGVDVLVTKD